MRVLVATSMYPVDDHPSLGTFVAEQVRALRTAGIGVDVVFINARQTRLNYAFALPGLIEALRATHYDVVHTHHSYTLPLALLARAIARARVPVVLTNHEGEVLDQTRHRPWHLGASLRHSIRLKRWATARADFVIFVSQRLSHAVSTNRRHAVIPCGVDLDRFMPLDRLRCRQQLGLPLDVPVLFFPPRPTAHGKRFELVETTYEIVRQTHPGARLMTGGAIPYARMPVYYNAADVVLQSSFYEASPTIVKEALACEIPLVSTDTGDTREVVGQVPYCFICADDPRTLAARVVQCLGHQAVGARAQLRARELGVDQVAQRLISIYRRLAEQVS